MSLTRLLPAWALVALWLAATGAAAAYFAHDGQPKSKRSRWHPHRGRVYILEACVLTLLAALWFGSLGADGWLLVFGLIGSLSALSFLPRDDVRSRPWWRRLLPVAATVARIVGAGGLLAWKLS